MYTGSPEHSKIYPPNSVITKIEATSIANTKRNRTLLVKPLKIFQLSFNTTLQIKMFRILIHKKVQKINVSVL